MNRRRRTPQRGFKPMTEKRCYHLRMEILPSFNHGMVRCLDCGRMVPLWEHYRNLSQALYDVLIKLQKALGQ